MENQDLVKCMIFIMMSSTKAGIRIAYASARVYLQIQINGRVSFFVKRTTLNLDHKQQWRCEKKKSSFKVNLSMEKE